MPTSALRCLLAAALLAPLAGAGAEPTSRTQLVLLGTGTPRPLPDRSGPCTAIVVDGTPYLVDAGPGLVRRAQAAADQGVAALAPSGIERVFVTTSTATTPWACRI